ncbi:hypothetical protein VOLCADRAFT_98567 [Volvox carteri f. nagariensis]|uniref:Uncharacterized protein n=1 Tax=Volvox carteri f. nagariensis TaxID=3068 RepID=D8UFP5_VOLCA|nr:uncharacterized protein VOLCADRAFT_98567 [Volvox carteri f. nagariensis]EFJ41495.1 hypothetical protein VOLCADRAFT_98567 [Volvox carteri f. nagariensis]|eukprot:XP_002957440.1 hypothetical protein VOLCADRAFT_98567 [Volvox carteri f. nagariensis]
MAAATAAATSEDRVAHAHWYMSLDIPELQAQQGWVHTLHTPHGVLHTAHFAQLPLVCGGRQHAHEHLRYFTANSGFDTSQHFEPPISKLSHLTIMFRDHMAHPLHEMGDHTLRLEIITARDVVPAPLLPQQVTGMNRQKFKTGFRGHCAGQQCFTAPGGPVQQHAAGGLHTNSLLPTPLPPVLMHTLSAPQKDFLGIDFTPPSMFTIREHAASNRLVFKCDRLLVGTAYKVHLLTLMLSSYNLGLTAPIMDIATNILLKSCKSGGRSADAITPALHEQHGAAWGSARPQDLKQATRVALYTWQYVFAAGGQDSVRCPMAGVTVSEVAAVVAVLAWDTTTPISIFNAPLITINMWNY